MSHAQTLKLFALLLSFPFFLTACDSGGANGDDVTGGEDPGETETNGLPEDYQEGWLLQLRGPVGMLYNYNTTLYDSSGDDVVNGTASGSLLDQEVYGPWNIKLGVGGEYAGAHVEGEPPPF